MESVSLYQLARQAKLQNATAVKRVDALATQEQATRERNALRAKLAAGYGLTPDPDPLPTPADDSKSGAGVDPNGVTDPNGAAPTAAPPASDAQV